MKTLLSLALLLGFTLSARAEFVPAVTRFPAKSQRGHNASNDESAIGCQLDVVLFRDGPRTTVMLFLWSDMRSDLTFRAFVPTTLLPLQEGARWEMMDVSYRYENGVLTATGPDREMSIKIGPRFLLAPEFAEARSQDGARWLNCEF